MQATDFGTLGDGRAVQSFALGGDGRLRVQALSYGARIAAIDVALADRTTRRVTLGYDTLAEHESDRAFLGALAGRYANRIAHGRFPLDGRTVQVSVNNGGNMLHGGAVGFDRAVWIAEPDGDALELRHTSPDGDQGFPGTLHASVRYTVHGDALLIDYVARTDAATVVNLTNHSYFNLSGEPTILDHRLTLAAERFTPVDAALIPTGVLQPVDGTPFDFRTPHAIGARIGAADEQLERARGYDHNFVLGEAPAESPRHAATVEAGGLVMEVLTTAPGVQFYSGNFLPQAGLPHRAAMCLETQHFPDSPNQPGFPTTLLRPGEVWRSRTIYRFTEAK